MKRRELRRYKDLKWYLDFISSEIDTLSEREFAKLLIDARYFLLGNPTPLFDSDVPEELDKIHPGELSLTPLPDDWPWKENLKKIQEKIKDFLRKNFIEAQDNESSMMKGVNLYFGLLGGKGCIRIYYGSLRGHFADINEIIKRAEINLISVLNSVPRDAIKSCPECGKFFLHLSKRPRYYCSPTCTSVAISRKRRENNPEKYKEYQRGVMRDKYRIERGLKPKKFYKGKAK